MTCVPNLQLSTLVLSRTHAGNLVLAFNPMLFQPSAEELGARVATVVGAVKGLPTLQGQSVKVPGEGSHTRFVTHIRDGYVTLPRSMYDTLQSKASQPA